MMQQVLARPHWAGRLTPTDLRGVTPLIWEHVNPYGRFELDMQTRLDRSPNGPWRHDWWENPNILKAPNQRLAGHQTTMENPSRFHLFVHAGTFFQLLP